MSGNITSANCSQLTTSSGKSRESALIASNIVLSVIIGLIAITSVLSNDLIIASVAKTPRLQKPANLIMCSIALNDLLTGLTTMPLLVTGRALFIHIGYSKCEYQTLADVARFFYILCVGASFVLLCLLSWDRYKAVSNPLLYRSNSSKSKTLKTIAITWFAWVAVAILMTVSPDSLHRFLEVMVAVPFLVLPTAVQVLTYKAMRRHNREIVATNSQATAATALAREKKLLITLRYVMAALAFSLGVPLVVFLATVSTKAAKSTQSHIMAWTNVFNLMNSCINPIIYFLRHPDMRTAAFRLIGH